MNQTEQMRELCPSCRNADIYACTCPFKTARNSQPECFEPAKLVRLTDDAVNLLAAQYLDITPSSSQIHDFLNAAIDAVEKLNNGGQQ